MLGIGFFTDSDGKLLPGRAISVAGTTVFALATATWFYLGVRDPMLSPTNITATAIGRDRVTLSWTQSRTLKSAPVAHNLIRGSSQGVVGRVDDGGIPLDGGVSWSSDALVTMCWCNRGRWDEEIPPGYPYALQPATVGSACAPPEPY